MSEKLTAQQLSGIEERLRLIEQKLDLLLALAGHGDEPTPTSGTPDKSPAQKWPRKLYVSVTQKGGGDWSNYDALRPALEALMKHQQLKRRLASIWVNCDQFLPTQEPDTQELATSLTELLARISKLYGTQQKVFEPKSKP